MQDIQSVFTNIYFLILFSVFISFLLSRRIIPVIIYISKTKNLMDAPDDRSSHVNITPTLGGVGIFIAFSLTVIFFGIFLQLSQQNLITLLAIIFGSIILLFLGVKDDLLVLSPIKKLMGQLIASITVVLMTDFRIDNLHGILGIGEIPPFFAIVLTVLVFIAIINAYNLTDGIDGLATTIALVSCLSFGIYFLVNEIHLMTLIAFSLAGSLFSFMLFNLSNTKKIFMGDSGSMVVGFLLAFQGVALFVINSDPSIIFKFNVVPAIFLAIFAFPILDTTRVFFIRIRQGRSPFSPDRNHIHHRLIDLGLDHQSATFIIYNTNIVIIVLAFIFDVLHFNVHVNLFLICCIACALYLFPFFLMQVKGKVKFSLPKLNLTN